MGSRECAGHGRRVRQTMRCVPHTHSTLDCALRTAGRLCAAPRHSVSIEPDRQEDKMGVCAYLSTRNVHLVFPLPVHVETGYGVGPRLSNVAIVVEKREREGAELRAALVTLVRRAEPKYMQAVWFSRGRRTRRAHSYGKCGERFIRRP